MNLNKINEMVNNINRHLEPLNNNKYMIGVAMIIFNIGSKFIMMDVSKSYETLLKSKIVRRITLFSIFFVATKDLFISFILTAIFIVITLNLFNDESKFCILPNSFRDNIHTKEEYELAKKIIIGYESKNKNIVNNK